MNKKIVQLISTIGIVSGIIVGFVNPVEIFFPIDQDPDGDNILAEFDQCPEAKENYNDFEDMDGCPDLIPQLDTTIEGFDHTWHPGRIAFSLDHDGTDEFYIKNITIRTKDFRPLECVDALPAKPESDFDRLHFKLDLTGPHHGPDEVLAKQDGEVKRFVYDEVDTGQLVFNYAIVDRITGTPIINQGYEFWMDYIIDYCELEDCEITGKEARYHAHYVQSPVECVS